jgi:hypothetical protein
MFIPLFEAAVLAYFVYTAYQKTRCAPADIWETPRTVLFSSIAALLANLLAFGARGKYFLMQQELPDKLTVAVSSLESIAIAIVSIFLLTKPNAVSTFAGNAAVVLLAISSTLNTLPQIYYGYRNYKKTPEMLATVEAVNDENRMMFTAFVYLLIVGSILVALLSSGLMWATVAGAKPAGDPVCVYTMPEVSCQDGTLKSTEFVGTCDAAKTAAGSLKWRVVQSNGDTYGTYTVDTFGACAVKPSVCNDTATVCGTKCDY